jgi:hypothetical protein
VEVQAMTGHVHDYKMVFDEDQPHTLNYEMVCECGDRCRTMQEAVERTTESRGAAPSIRPRDVVAILFVAGAGLFVFAACIARWG